MKDWQKQWDIQREIYDGWMINISPFKRFVLKFKRFLSELKTK